MEFNKKHLAVAIMAATLVGCGSDDDDSDPVSAKNYDVSCNADNSRCFVSGKIDEDFTMTADTQWVLDGSVFVGEGQVEITSAAQVQEIKDAGVTLTVEAGTDVRGLSNATLVITRGSKIMAEGTAAAPITFSSDADDNYDGLGEWGGVIVQGFAPQYGPGNTGVCSEGLDGFCNVEGEGGLDETIRYGGVDAADNSGVIKYVRIAEGGRVAGPGNEVNGLTMQGVGHGTTIEYIQIHDNLDDGLEWFGGTVNVKYAVLTGNDDDPIDFDEGYQGNIQYAIVLQDQDEEATPTGSNDPRGIEANSSDDEYVPQTAATLANITVINGPISSGEPGIRLRGSVNVDLVNTVVASTGANNGCIRIDDSDHDGNSETAKIDTPVNIVNVITSGCSTTYNKEDPETESGLTEEVAVFDAAVALTNTAATLGSAPTITAVDNGSNFAFDATTYIGAVAPGTAAASAWWAGWIIEGSLDEVSDYNAAFTAAE